MDYSVTKSALYSLVDEEISKIADDAYNEDGTSLYDSIVLTTKDRSTVDRFIDDAAAHLVRTAWDISSFDSTNMNAGTKSSSISGSVNIHFEVPDFPSAHQAAALNEITRYITLFAVAGIVQQRRAAVAPEYANRVQAALDNVIAIVRTRQAPTR